MTVIQVMIVIIILHKACNQHKVTDKKAGCWQNAESKHFNRKEKSDRKRCRKNRADGSILLKNYLKNLGEHY